MVDRWWLELPRKFAAVVLDAHVVMPDHFHGIVLLHHTQAAARPPVSLVDVIDWFKTMTTNEYFRRVKSDGWQPVDRRLWQRSFYDHVIRDEGELLQIRAYIESNAGALLERYGGKPPGT